jgi:hypothetical protein
MIRAVKLANKFHTDEYQEYIKVKPKYTKQKKLYEWQLRLEQGVKDVKLFARF